MRMCWSQQSYCKAWFLSSRSFLRLIGLATAVMSAAQIFLLTRATTTTISSDDNEISVETRNSNKHHSHPDAATARHETRSRILNNNSSINISNRTLVVLMGNLRGGENAWSTLYDHVLDVNHADLALLIGDTPPQYIDASLFRRAKYVWKFQEYDDWADAVDEVYGNATWRTRLLPLAHENGEMLGGIQGQQYNFRGSGLLIYIFRWYLTLHIQRLELLQRYDRFIVTRADHYYKCHHNISLLDVANYIYVPKGQNYHGITDRHFVASSRDILSALNLLPPILDNPENYRDLLAEKNTNPERVIARRWQEEGLLQRLKRFDRVMFTCGQAGDPTRHKTLSIAVQPENVQLKYEREYVASYKSCNLYMPKDRSKQILSNLSSLCAGGAICTAQ